MESWKDILKNKDVKNNLSGSNQKLDDIPRKKMIDMSKKEPRISLNDDFTLYNAADSRLYIDGELIQKFPVKKPMFGIKDGKLIISQFIAKNSSWKKILNGHQFDIVSLIDDDLEFRIHGDYDNQEINSQHDVIFDGTIPTITLEFSIEKVLNYLFEPINYKYYPEKNNGHKNGGLISHDKHLRV